MKAARSAIVDALVGEQIADVEQVARMLAVEGGDDLAGIEIGEGEHLHLGKAEGGLDGGRDAAQLGRVGAAAHDRRDLDLDLHAGLAHEQLGDGAFGGCAA